ncbi:MAG TPA: DUF72 domain-containing protein [Polyangiaceae bacterium]|nr:DUF72 domain-containing protein [Polyangiaceae bacterium]
MPESDPAPLREATQLALRAPVPARVSNIVTGTAGWTEPTLIKSGRFYPRGTNSAKARLEFYAGQFSMVEVDATYYTLLTHDTVQRWCDSTPPGFVFHIKAHPVLTGHPIDLRKLPKDVREPIEALGFDGRAYAERLPAELQEEIERRFFAPLELLEAAHKLGVVLLQYPPWFTATRGNVKRIEELRARYPDVRFAVEFRHKSWLEPRRSERVFSMLAAEHMTYVCVDEPEGAVGGLPPTVVVTTAEFAYLRFHGRNRAGWSRRGATVQERFDYLYSQEELARWVDPTRKAAREAERVHAVFNNCVQNYAVLNAKGLVVLLGL